MKEGTQKPKDDTLLRSVVEVVDPEYPNIKYRVILSKHIQPNTVEEVGKVDDIAGFFIEDASTCFYPSEDSYIRHLSKKDIRSSIRSSEDSQYLHMFKLAKKHGIPIYPIDMYMRPHIDELSELDRRFFIKGLLAVTAIAPLGQSNTVKNSAAVGLMTAWCADSAQSNFAVTLSNTVEDTELMQKARIDTVRVLGTLNRFFNGATAKYVIDLRNSVMTFKTRVAIRKSVGDDKTKQHTAVLPVGAMHFGVIADLKQTDERLLSRVEKDISDLVSAAVFIMEGRAFKDSATEEKEAFITDIMVVLQSIPVQTKIVLRGAYSINIEFNDVAALKKVIAPQKDRFIKETAKALLEE